MSFLLRQLFDSETSTYTYLVADRGTKQAVLIDPVLTQIERDIALVVELGLTLVHSAETHVHADHVTASGHLRDRLSSTCFAGTKAGIECVDHELEHLECFSLGGLSIECRHTPGHTEGCVTYVVKHNETLVAFTGDTLLIRGCGRSDFQGGDSGRLYDSVHQQIFTLPDDTPLYPGHDYRGFRSTTVLEEKQYNRRLKLGISKSEFISIMANLDLSEPKHMHVALPANLACGKTPAS